MGAVSVDCGGVTCMRNFPFLAGQARGDLRFGNDTGVAGKGRVWANNLARLRHVQPKLPGDLVNAIGVAELRLSQA